MRMTVEDMCFGYSGGEDSVSHLSASFDEGSFVGIIGPNGSGKTTLLKLMSGELHPYAGRCTIEGVRVDKMPNRALAKLIAVVPQKSHLTFNFTVLDVVLMGRHAHMNRFQTESAQDVERAKRAMEAVGILELESRSAVTLSGGEWQRVIIARALCQDTPAILLDEPIASLDIKHQIDVMKLIATIAHKKRVLAVCVMHDLNLAAHYCDRLLLMHKGKLLCEGTPADVITPEHILRAYGIDAFVDKNLHGKPVMTPVYA